MRPRAASGTLLCLPLRHVTQLVPLVTGSSGSDARRLTQCRIPRCAHCHGATAGRRVAGCLAGLELTAKGSTWWLLCCHGLHVGCDGLTQLKQHSWTLHRNERFVAEKAERDAQRKAIMRETAGEPYNKEVRSTAVVKLCQRQGMLQWA